MASDSTSIPTKQDVEILQRQFDSKFFEYQLSCRDTKVTAAQVPATATRLLNGALAWLHEVAVFIRGNYDPSTADAGKRANLFKSTAAAFLHASDMVHNARSVIAEKEQKMNSLQTEFAAQKTSIDGVITNARHAIETATREQGEKTAMLEKLKEQLKAQSDVQRDLEEKYHDWQDKDAKANAIASIFHAGELWKYVEELIPPLDFHSKAANAKAEVAKSESLVSDTEKSIRELSESIQVLGSRRDALLALKGSLDLMETKLADEKTTAGQCVTEIAALAKVARGLYSKALTLSKKAKIIVDPTSPKRSKDVLAGLIMAICESVLEGQKLGVDKKVKFVVDEIIGHYGSEVPEDITAIASRISYARSKRAPPAQHLEILGASYAGIDITPAVREAVIQDGNKALSLRPRTSSGWGFIYTFLNGRDPMPGVKKALTVLYQFEGQEMELLVTWDGSEGDTDEVLITEPLPPAKDRVREKGWNITRIPMTTSMDDIDEEAVAVLAIAYGYEYCTPEKNPDIYTNIAELALGDTYQVSSETFGGNLVPNVTKTATVFYTRGLSPVFVAGAQDFGDLVFEE
ncbi:hypothetical protein N657DRAFT_675631 [Parathielavia appendiculata]|uniref:Uncharacterized protein n=1 Tax=Parathielavia appendiculata TaxID=2587402 RepID=A0AAN6YYI7_9PEZI|nr:hypothetical protein N657DRAFT_675631 [Parathielavia appendiculata]